MYLLLYYNTMNIKLTFNLQEQELFDSLSNDNSLTMTTSQLYNLSVYMDVIKKSKGEKKMINNQDNILQACNYDSDDNCKYWVILDRDLNFTDIGIPFNVNLDNEKSFENLPEFESNIIKLIKKCEN